MRHPLIILFGYVFVFLGGMCVLPLVDELREHYDCLIALLVHVGTGVLLTVFFGWQALLLTLIIPYFIAGRHWILSVLCPAQLSWASPLTTLPGGRTRKPRWNPRVF